MEYIIDHFLIFSLLIAAVFTFFWLRHFRDRLKIGTITTIILTVSHVSYGVLCVKAFAFLESGAAPGAFSNMSIFGAVFFMPLAYFLGGKLFKRKISDVFDIFTICTVFTLGCSRVNCIISGCCSGIQFFGTSFCWPTREIEILFYLVFIAIYAPKIWNEKTNGEIYPLYMFIYGAIRFLLEFVRISTSPYVLHLTHLWAFISFSLGFVILEEQRHRGKRNMHRNTKGGPTK